MIPCKKCGSYYVEIAFLGPEEHREWFVACIDCQNESESSLSKERAWKNWETENAKE